jgi:hypothetical protein
MQAVVTIRLDGYIDRNTLNKGGKRNLEMKYKRKFNDNNYVHIS